MAAGAISRDLNIDGVLTWNVGVALPERCQTVGGAGVIVPPLSDLNEALRAAW